MTTKIKSNNITSGSITADLLSATAITDKLGYIPADAASSAGAGPIAVNATLIDANTAIPPNYNGVSLGSITVDTGVTVTIASGSKWQIN